METSTAAELIVHPAVLQISINCEDGDPCTDDICVSSNTLTTPQSGVTYGAVCSNPDNNSCVSADGMSLCALHVRKLTLLQHTAGTSCFCTPFMSINAYMLRISEAAWPCQHAGHGRVHRVFLCRQPLLQLQPYNGRLRRPQRGEGCLSVGSLHLKNCCCCYVANSQTVSLHTLLTATVLCRVWWAKLCAMMVSPAPWTLVMSMLLMDAPTHR